MEELLIFIGPAVVVVGILALVVGFFMKTQRQKAFRRMEKMKKRRS